MADIKVGDEVRECDLNAFEHGAFTATSVYAGRTNEWRATAHRMEMEFNAERRTARARQEASEGHTVRYASDDLLRRLAVRYRRDLEDVESGDLPGGPRRARLLKAQLRDVECEQAIRAALAESWQAREDGTHSYTAFQGRGGLRAVVENAATPPSYELAAWLDWEHWKRGLPCVLAWS